MHRNVVPDVLPRSATFVRVLDRWLNGLHRQPLPNGQLLHYAMYAVDLEWLLSDNREH